MIAGLATAGQYILPLVGLIGGRGNGFQTPILLQPHRLDNLLSARLYRHHEHDVFTLDTAPLVHSHEHSIWLTPMNSGNTFPFAARRGLQAFRRIGDYPATSTGRPVKEFVELVVDYSVADIAKHVIEIRRMTGPQVIETLFKRVDKRNAVQCQSCLV